MHDRLVIQDGMDLPKLIHGPIGALNTDRGSPGSGIASQRRAQGTVGSHLPKQT